MNIVQTVFESVQDLPREKAKQVLYFIQFLAKK